MKNNCVARKFTEILNLITPPLRKTLRFSGAVDEPPHAMGCTQKFGHYIQNEEEPGNVQVYRSY